MNILHLAPHPDDESIACPATLLALLDAGHNVMNFAVSLGRAGDEPRRLMEVSEACERMGLSLIVADPVLAISSKDDLQKAEQDLTDQIIALGKADSIDLIIAPSNHDAHHGHEVVGRAAIAAAQALATPLWMWGLWADLALPNILHAFSEDLLLRAEYALEAHAGENDRNNYLSLLRTRGKANTILGAERVFGFGADGIEADYAELLCEVHPMNGKWLYGQRRFLDAQNPIGDKTNDDFTWRMEAKSAGDIFRENARRSQ